MNVSNIAEPVKLTGEGNYNLNVLKEIDVTDSHLGLDQDIRGCQNEEPQDHCRTRVHRDTLLKQCGCLPFNMRLSDNVWTLIFTKTVLIYLSSFRNLFACQKI